MERTDAEKLELIRQAVLDWNNQTGHNRCWYYPLFFKFIAEVVGVDVPAKPDISREEFEAGCKQFQDEEFGLQKPPDVV
jgi:hypothetical protein